MLQAAQLIICHLKSKIYKNIRTAMIIKLFLGTNRTFQLPFFWVSSQNTLLVSFKNCQTQYRQRHIQSPIKDLRCSFWRQQFTVPEAYSERSRTPIMKLFEKNILSRPIFQPFTIYTKSSILDVPLYSEYTSGTINYFCNRLHLAVWLGSR